MYKNHSSVEPKTLHLQYHRNINFSLNPSTTPKLFPFTVSIQKNLKWVSKVRGGKTVMKSFEKFPEAFSIFSSSSVNNRACKASENLANISLPCKTNWGLLWTNSNWNLGRRRKKFVSARDWLWDFFRFKIGALSLMAAKFMKKLCTITHLASSKRRKINKRRPFELRTFFN